MNADPAAIVRGDEDLNPAASRALWWGLLLTVGGALWLVDATRVVIVSPYVVAAFFALAGVTFAVDFAGNARNWWAAVPAGALIGLASLIAYTEATTSADEWGAAMLLAGSGLGFTAGYVRERTRWWALMPAGLLLGVAVIVASVPLVGGGNGIAVIVLGIIAATFVALAVLPIRGRRLWWLIFPAGVLGVVAAFLARDAAELLEPFNWVAPTALVLVGLGFLARRLSGAGAGRRGP